MRAVVESRAEVPCSSGKIIVVGSGGGCARSCGRVPPRGADAVPADCAEHEELRRGNVLEDGCEAVVGQGEEGERLIGRGGQT